MEKSFGVRAEKLNSAQMRVELRITKREVRFFNIPTRKPFVLRYHILLESHFLLHKLPIPKSLISRYYVANAQRKSKKIIA